MPYVAETQLGYFGTSRRCHFYKRGNKKYAHTNYPTTTTTTTKDISSPVITNTTIYFQILGIYIYIPPQYTSIKARKF
jgi:hypothetical protein